MDINSEITAYDQMKDDLETNYMGQWVVIHEQKLVATYPTFQQAADDAVSKFGRGPYLIRQVGAPPLVMPASVMYHVGHGAS